MKLEQSFDVKAPIDVVWRALNDLERVAPCLPGASITGHDEDGTYHGEFKVKLGPTTAAYRGTIKITESDEATHTATLSAKGSDKRGQGGAHATIVNTLTEEGDATRVNAVTDFSITGRLARFGRGGMIEDISNKLLQNFAACLATRLAEAPSGADVAAGAAPAEAAAPPAAAAGEATGAEVAAGDSAPEEIVAPSVEPAATGGEVAAGDAAPEAAAAPAPADTSPAAGDAAPASGAPGAAGGPAPASPAPGGALGGGSAPDASWGGGAPPVQPVSTAPPATSSEPATAQPDPADAVAASRPAATPSQAGPAQPPASEPLKVGGLFWSVLWERIKRLFGGGRKP